MLTYGLPVVYIFIYKIYKSILSLKIYLLYKHGRKATLIKGKCWMHISAKLTLLYSYIRSKTLRNYSYNMKKTEKMIILIRVMS